MASSCLQPKMVGFDVVCTPNARDLVHLLCVRRPTRGPIDALDHRHALAIRAALAIVRAVSSWRAAPGFVPPRFVGGPRQDHCGHRTDETLTTIGEIDARVSRLVCFGPPLRDVDLGDRRVPKPIACVDLRVGSCRSGVRRPRSGQARVDRPNPIDPNRESRRPLVFAIAPRRVGKPIAKHIQRCSGDDRASPASGSPDNVGRAKVVPYRHVDRLPLATSSVIAIQLLSADGLSVRAAHGFRAILLLAFRIARTSVS